MYYNSQIANPAAGNTWYRRAWVYFLHVTCMATCCCTDMVELLLNMMSGWDKLQLTQSLSWSIGQGVHFPDHYTLKSISMSSMSSIMQCAYCSLIILKRWPWFLIYLDRCKHIPQLLASINMLPANVLCFVPCSGIIALWYSRTNTLRLTNLSLFPYHHPVPLLGFSAIWIQSSHKNVWSW